MDKLKSMQVLVYVAENGSFASAAVHFAVSPTMIGKHIRFLEEQLGTRLISRTTRKQSLTESGMLYYQECKGILDAIKHVENQVQTFENSPRGTVRINSPVTFGNLILAPMISDFLQQYPEINIELILDNNRIDPILEQVDLIIRIGKLPDSNLIARKLGDYQMVFCASPSYLEREGVPESVDDLDRHTCLGFAYGDVQPARAVRLDTHAFDRTNTRLLSNSGHVLKVAAVNGLGIILQPRLSLTGEFKARSLTEILPDEAPAPMPINLLYRHKALPLKTRTFVDFLTSRLLSDRHDGIL